MIENHNDYILGTEGAVDVVGIETERGRERYHRLIAENAVTDLGQEIAWCHTILNRANIPSNDYLPSRIAFILRRLEKLEALENTPQEISVADAIERLEKINV